MSKEPTERKDPRRFLIGLLLGLALLVLAFRKVEYGALVKTLASFNLWWLPLFMMAHLAVLWLRSWRWRVVVSPIQRVGHGDIFCIIVRGFLINNLLPMKAGDLYRVHALGERSKLSKATVLGTLLVERLADLAGLVLLSAGLAWIVPLPESLRHALPWMGGLLAGGIVLWWVASRVLIDRGDRPGAWGKLSRRINRLSFPRVVESLRQGLSVLRDLRQWVTLLATTGLILVSYALGIVLIMRGFNVKGLSIMAPIAQLVFIFWSSLLPQAPAGVGTFEYASLLALQLFGVDREAALAIALVLHAGIIANLLFLNGIAFFAPMLAGRFNPRVDIEPS